MTPQQQPTKYSPAYEDYYEDGIPVGTTSPSPSGWALPALYKIGERLTGATLGIRA